MTSDINRANLPMRCVCYRAYTPSITLTRGLALARDATLSPGSACQSLAPPRSGAFREALCRERLCELQDVDPPAARRRLELARMGAPRRRVARSSDMA